jgi:hypothetical protein
MIPRAHVVHRCTVLIALALLMLAPCHAQEPVRPDTIATIAAHHAITFTELQEYVRDYPYLQLHRDNKAEAYVKGLDDMIVNQLKRMDFFARGMDSTAEALQEMRRPINEELVIRYYTTQFYRRYVNEDSMQNGYRQMSKEVLFQQVDLPIPQSASRNSVDSLGRLAKAIWNRARGGEDLVKAAKGVAPRGGGNGVQSMDWKLSLTDTLNYTIFHLPANEVRMFRSRESFHIVKVLNIKTVDVPPYPTVREDIRKALDERYGSVSQAEFERLKTDVVDETKARWNAQGLRKILKWSNVPKFYQTGFEDTLRNAIAHGRNVDIVKLPKFRVDLKEYLRLVRDVLSPAEFTSIKEDDIKQFILEAVRTSIIVEKAMALGLAKEVLVATTSSPVLKHRILRLYNRHLIEDQIPPATEQALHEFYQANRDSLYYHLAKVNVYAIIDSNRDVVLDMKAKLEQNVPFEKLAPRMLVKTYVRNRDSSFSTYFGTEPAFLAAAAFRMNLNETAGPIEYDVPGAGKHYALIKCVGIREEKQLSYDEAKKTAPDDFANFHRDRISGTVRDRLKAHYGVAIDNDVFQKCLRSIGIDLH